jgi:hypothetical protein
VAVIANYRHARQVFRVPPSPLFVQGAKKKVRLKTKNKQPRSIQAEKTEVKTNPSGVV